MKDLSVEQSTFLAIAVTWAFYGLLSHYVYNAFVVERSFTGTASYLSLYHRPIIGADYLAYWICNVITETLILWRVYTIWRGNPRRYMILPGLLYAANLVVSTVVVVTHVRQSVLQYDRHDKANYRMMVILAVVLMAENVVCSGMIAGRLWYMGRLVSAGKTRFPYMSVIRAVLESAALYSVTFLILVVLTTTGYYHAADIVLKALAILVGIVPTLMWFSSNFKIARDAGFAQPVTARGNISTDVEAAAGGGNSYAEWKFAPANGAIYSKLGTGHETITLPEPLFFGDQGACSACSGSSTARTLSPS